MFPETPRDFVAGQYLQVVMADDDKRPFSIASSPDVPDKLELQIGAPEGNAYARQVIERLQNQSTIEIELPFGRAGIDVQSTRDILIMVGGTGFAYAKSIIEYLVEHPPKGKVYLYWGGRNLGGLYLHELAYHWHEQGIVEFVPVIEQAVPQWEGRLGLVHEAVLDDFEDMSGFDVYVAGRFEMAGTARDAFAKRGLPLSQLHGDAYEFI
jgi:aquacobalamin reductase/NAD(P)H-flavin reductase